MVQKIIIICGPTAVGKTRLSIELAKRFDAEIVSADSQQVWRGMDIGTAKANLTERSDVTHHLIDIADPNEHFDAARFVELADRAIEDIAARGRRIFVVGGTGMYLRMLVHGLCDAPPQDPQIRGQIEAEVKVKGLQELHNRLMEVDPESALAIHPNDRTRIVRALEIYERTGTPASEFRKMHGYASVRYVALKIGLTIDRGELYRRIDERIDTMLKAGLLDEVRRIVATYGPDVQALTAVGYREFVRHLQGELSLDEAAQLVKRNSRHFAKRQLTWFCADDEIHWFHPDEIGELTTNIESFYRNDVKGEQYG